MRPLTPPCSRSDGVVECWSHAIADLRFPIFDLKSLGSSWPEVGEYWSNGVLALRHRPMDIRHSSFPWASN